MASLGISANVFRGGAPLSVTFNASALSINVVSWLWDFGDGFYSTLQSPTHIYRNPGKFNVRLTVTDTVGTEYTDIEEEYIVVFRLAINSSSPKGKVPFKVKFSFTEYIPEGYQLDSYIWDFGDSFQGGTGISGVTGSSPVHEFKNAGSFPVKISGKISRV